MTRFALFGEQLCISVEALASIWVDVPFERAVNRVKKSLERARSGGKYYKHYQDEADTRKKWIVIDTLPDLVRGMVDKHYGDCRLAYNNERLEYQAESRVERGDFEYFILNRMPRDKAFDLAQGCGWMRLSVSDYWQGRWPGKMQFYTSIVEVLRERNLYGMKVAHEASLRRKIRDWNKLGRESLLHGNASTHKNSISDASKAHKRIVDLYCSPLKPSKMKVYEIYTREAAEKGWPQYTYQRVVQILNTPEVRQIATVARHGEAAARQLMERTIKRSRPSFADALWTLDGTTVQLVHLDERGKIASELYIVAVADAYSRDLVGYAIGSTETGALVQSALRNAVRRSGYSPLQLQYDNSSANKSAEAQTLFAKLGATAFPTAPYNGKSKIIEALYGHIEQGFLRHFPNFKGGNITAKSLDARANPDLIRELVRSGEIPTKQQALAQLKLAIETYRNTVVKMAGKTPREMYAEENPERKPLEYLQQVNLLWVERRNLATYTKDGISIEVDGVRHTYEVEKGRGVEDMTFRMEHLGDRFRVMYDPEDLSTVALFNEAHKYVATAARKWEAPMAKADSQAGDGEIIADALSDRQEYLDRLRRKAKEVREEMELEEVPVLDFQLAHKDAFNRMEQAELDKLLEETARVVAYEDTAPKRRRRKSLYDDESADGSLITD